MRIIAIMFCCLAFCSGYAQQDEIKQLLAQKNISAQSTVSDESEFVKLCAQAAGEEAAEESDSLDLISPKTICSFEKFRTQKSRAFPAYSVFICYVGPNVYHVADYYDGTRVVTALDGEFCGYQAIGVNGVLVFESNIVEWHRNYFVHKYPNGRVVSYPTSQVIKIKR